MNSLNRLCSRFLLIASLSAGIILPIKNAHATDAQTAGIAKMIGAVLLMHGLYSTYKDITGIMEANTQIAACSGPSAGTCTPPWETKKAVHTKKLPLDLLETVGGAAAMMINGQSEQDMKDQNGYMPGGAPGGGAPGGGLGSDVAGTCASMPEICSFDPTTNKPQITKIPSVDAMKAALTESFKGQPVNADGLSLDEALNDLDEKYAKAAEAVAAFNSAANSGAFDGSGDSELAGTGQGDGDAADGEGLSTGRSLAGAGSAPSFDALTLPNGQTTDWNTLLNKTKAERGGLKGANALGLNLQDAKTGRILSLWERVSRAIRGTRDRDILLAKVEWNRQQAAKKQGKKKSNFAVSTEKN